MWLMGEADAIRALNDSLNGLSELDRALVQYKLSNGVGRRGVLSKAELISKFNLALGRDRCVAYADIEKNAFSKLRHNLLVRGITSLSEALWLLRH